MWFVAEVQFGAKKPQTQMSDVKTQFFVHLTTFVVFDGLAKQATKTFKRRWQLLLGEEWIHQYISPYVPSEDHQSNSSPPRIVSWGHPDVLLKGKRRQPDENFVLPTGSQSVSEFSRHLRGISWKCRPINIIFTKSGISADSLCLNSCNTRVTRLAFVFYAVFWPFLKHFGD